MVILTFQTTAATMGIFHSNNKQQKKRVEKKRSQGPSANQSCQFAPQETPSLEASPIY